MKTVGLIAGALGVVFVAAAGCGGTVVFEEDGGEGGQTSVTMSVSTGSPDTSVAVTSTGGPSSSTGTSGCGSLLDDIGGLGSDGCDGCMEAQCCSELLACDQGTDCYDCIFTGECSDEANAALQDFSACYSSRCNDACNGPSCDPGDFRCVESGECIPGEWQCDGFPDCGDGTDEQFCNQDGICDSSVATGDPGTDQCLGEFCCQEFNECSNFGQNVNACYTCLQNGGGPQCDEAIECAFSSPCLEGGGEDICGTGLSTGDPGTDQCLNQNCCDEFDFCVSGPQGVNGCVNCFNNGGGPRCNDAIACFENSCGGF